jgi:hypothetical protein
MLTERVASETAIEETVWRIAFMAAADTKASEVESGVGRWSS